jgi:hypothetical protein
MQLLRQQMTAGVVVMRSAVFIGGDEGWKMRMLREVF